VSIQWSAYPEGVLCSACGAADAIESGVCQVCDHPAGAADLPAAAPAPPEPAPSLRPPLRFADVILELKRLDALAERIGGPNAYRAALLSRQVRGLLTALRDQFVFDVTSREVRT
jgi:hypothetical protein